MKMTTNGTKTGDILTEQILSLINNGDGGSASNFESMLINKFEELDELSKFRSDGLSDELLQLESKAIESWDVRKLYKNLGAPVTLVFEAVISLKDFFILTDDHWDYEKPFANNFDCAVKKLQLITKNHGIEASSFYYSFVDGGEIIILWETNKPIIVEKYVTYLKLLVEFDAMLQQLKIPGLSIGRMSLNEVVKQDEDVQVCTDASKIFNSELFKPYGDSLNHLSYGLQNCMRAQHELDNDDVMYSDYENLDPEDYAYACWSTLSHELHEGVKQETYYF